MDAGGEVERDGPTAWVSSDLSALLLRAAGVYHER